MTSGKGFSEVGSHSCSTLGSASKESLKLLENLLEQFPYAYLNDFSKQYLKIYCQYELPEEFSEANKRSTPGRTSRRAEKFGKKIPTALMEDYGAKNFSELFFVELLQEISKEFQEELSDEFQIFFCGHFFLVN